MVYNIFSLQDQKAVKVALSIWWLSPLEKNKKFILQTVLQSWVSTHKSTSTDELTCNVESVSKDSTNVVVSIKPPPGAQWSIELFNLPIPIVPFLLNFSFSSRLVCAGDTEGADAEQEWQRNADGEVCLLGRI